MKNVQFKQNGLFLELEVPGLAEKRPSILKGDNILAEKVIKYVKLMLGG